MSDRSVLLIIGGGVAAYKCLELIRLLAKRGIGARAILTRAGAEFVTPLSVGALTGDKVYTELFDLTAEAEMGHIELSRSADLVVVAPATADLLARAANGHANDLASTAILATDKPVLYAPAMNVRMWEHKATQRNLRQLKEDGALFVGPDEGDMACGEFGYGRLAEPPAIVDAIEGALSGGERPLSGRRILVTAGPTHEPLDPVRYLANRSSGKQGFAIAGALARLGADVTLISGPVSLEAPSGVKLIRVETAMEMLAASEAALPADAAIMCAAVADYRPEIETNHKIKKERGGLTNIPLSENPDILQTIAGLPEGERPTLVIGFAAETDDVIAYARSKRERKKCDWIVANDVSEAGLGVMGGDANEIVIIDEAGEESWPAMPKDAVAARLAARIAKSLS
ncbi:MAG: bifunctional phosphopantothenoylcysteine decarboxylase/phosphopantothenate--cysteine ligase CoaBC [Pseudomonadota bacterium]